jgi:NAD(P)-dependent dehydrogenase (short-subunit alcohol dehydrogenase family)
VVTGGASGIGRRISESALEAGYDVAVGDRNEEQLGRFADEVASDRLSTTVVDVTDEDAVDRWVTALTGERGAPDVLVNNAGIGRFAALEDLRPADWRAVVEVNLTAAFLVTQRVGREMIAAGRGSIVSIASVAGLAPSAGAGAYSPSKAGIAMLMKVAAVEWGRHGIRANSVSPGFVKGGLATDFYKEPGVEEGRRARVPLGRLGTEADVAAAVLYLASDAASYVSGLDLVVDGAWSQTASSSAPRFSTEVAR